MSDDAVFAALRTALTDLTAAGKQCALVGGIAVSVRAEVRFTRDVDLAVVVQDDRDAESLVAALRHRGYTAVATVEHETQARLATVRLLSPSGVKVDLLFATCGIEQEIVSRASHLDIPDVGEVSVAQPEELLAMKVVSMSDQRLQDRIDASRLLARNPGLDLDQVRENLRLIEERGFHRQQDLQAKIQAVLEQSGA